MELTLIGLFTLATCAYLLLFGSVNAMICALALFSLMGGSAAISLPVFGGSSIQPGIVAAGFLVMRLAVPGQAPPGLIMEAVASNIWLCVFTIYGAITAYILPVIFAHTIEITPLRPEDGKHLYAVSSLIFRTQNITISVYLVIDLLIALAGFIAMRRPNAGRNFVRVAIAVAVIHAVTGLAGAVLKGTPAEVVFTFFRNGGYAQLSQTVAGTSRITGIWPEPSVYALYGMIWFVFLTELWLRGVRMTGVGASALLLGATLLASTSSTAIIGCGAYALILGARYIAEPERFGFGKILAAVSFGLILACVALAILAADGPTSRMLQKVLSKILFEKTTTESGLQRLFWAKQGVEAFLTSYGLGIGAGSFRSSSIISAILGSTGVVGIISIIAHSYRVWQPFSPANFYDDKGTRDEEYVIARSAGWAAILYLVPSAFTAPSPDPGYIWAFFSAVALSLGQSRWVVRRASPISGSRHSAYSGLARAASMPIARRPLS